MTYRIILFLELKFVESYLNKSRFLFEINSASSCSSDLNIFGDLRRDQLIWILENNVINIILEYPPPELFSMLRGG